MVQTIVFLLVLGFPFIVYLINAIIAQRGRGGGGIAAGIPKPREARPAGTSRPRTAKVRSNRVQFCGRGFAHFALALVGSQQSCKYCTYTQDAPTPIRPEPPTDGDWPRRTPPPPGVDDDRKAAIREAEEIIERWKQ